MIGRVRGTIARRILLNYRIDPDVARRRLPSGFEPKLANGHAIGGICLIRLERARPAGLPGAIGLSSENAAHRFAAYRSEGDTREDCVYIARRHTGSMLILALGRVVPIEHYPARFDVRAEAETIDLSFAGADGIDVRVRVRRTAELPASSAFGSIDEASSFFHGGALGYSEKRSGAGLDALRLETRRWEITPLAIEAAQSSFFDDRALFPAGSIELDCALLMTQIEHDWVPVRGSARGPQVSNLAPLS